MLKAVWCYRGYCVESVSKDVAVAMIRAKVACWYPGFYVDSKHVIRLGYRHKDNIVRACPEPPEKCALFDLGRPGDWSFIAIPSIEIGNGPVIHLKQGSFDEGLAATWVRVSGRRCRIWVGLDYVPDSTMAWSDELHAWVTLRYLAQLDADGWTKVPAE